MDPEFVTAVGRITIDVAKANPSALGWIVLAVVVCTIVSVFAGIWRKLSGPEKVAMASSNMVLRGLGKIASVFGLPLVKVVDGFVLVWCGTLNHIARWRKLPEPYPPVPMAILTSGRGEAPTVTVVLPAEKTTVPAIVPQGMVEAAKAEAAAERAAAAGTQETKS